MKNFTSDNNIVRKVWSRQDTTLFVFAGASAEFALNKAVDWLYFTGKLPADPLGRLMSTVKYAKMIVFASEENAHKAIDSITYIHKAVEKNRGQVIPDWAYRDVLFMLIHYSIASFELLDRKMTLQEKEELYEVFFRMGTRMNIPDLPNTYQSWLPVREAHMKENLQFTHYTKDLFLQYKKHLGAFRFWILWEVQKVLCPAFVTQLLHMKGIQWAKPMLSVYRTIRGSFLEKWVRQILLPKNVQL